MWTPTIFLLLVYCLVLLLLSFDKRSGHPVQFLLAGRLLSLPALVLTLVTTWYGGILGVGEFAWRYGISTWVVFGIPYYIAALIFALFLAPRLRRSKAVSIPDLLEQHYGRSTAIKGAAGVWVATIPVAYVLMLASLIREVTGMPLYLAAFLGAAFSAWYVGTAGFRSVVRTDALQFFLMYLGFFVLLPMSLHRIGGFSRLWAALPSAHRRWDGGLGLQGVLVWYLIAMQTIVEPAFYQRVFAARDGSTARRGVMISVFFWILFDFLTVFSGLAARVLLPELDNPLMAFPALATLVLPPWLAGVFTVALFATVMSTLDSYLFLSAATLGHDFRPGRIEKGRIRAALWVSACLAAGASLFFSSAVKIWHDIGSILTSALLIPTLALHLPERFRPGSDAAGWCIVVSALTAVLWILWPGGYPANIEPMFPALGVGMLISVSSILGKKYVSKTKSRESDI